MFPIEIAFDPLTLGVLAFIAAGTTLAFAGTKPTATAKKVIKYGALPTQVAAYAGAYFAFGATPFTVLASAATGVVTYAGYRAVKAIQKRFGK